MCSSKQNQYSLVLIREAFQSVFISVLCIFVTITRPKQAIPLLTGILLSTAYSVDKIAFIYYTPYYDNTVRYARTNNISTNIAVVYALFDFISFAYA